MDKCQCSVHIKNLYVKRGGHTILNNINLTANHGETLALIGKNGAGKTTILKSILKRIEFKGDISFFNSKGQKIANPKIGYVPQRLSFEHSTPMTVMDLFCANSSRLPIWIGHSKKRKIKALEMLRKVGAEKHLDKPIGKLSGGELQRVLLAFALDPMPDILLLDEPVSAIDRNGIAQFYNIINSLRDDYHMPIVLVSHDLSHVAKYATSYALINHTVIETGSAKDLHKSKNVQNTFGINLEGGEELWK